MLHCGSTWRPRRIIRVIETISTSTRPAKVATDQGIGFLKGMGNPAGAISLATELVAGELARWLGLKTPEFAILGVVDLEIPMAGVGNMLNGPGFISREMKGTVGDGSD
jgi:hypothetical protein